MRKLIGTATGILIAVALTVLLAEALYRYYLSSIVAAEIAKTFKPDERPSFGAYGVAPWIFDRDQGFVFNQRPWLAAIFKDGAFTGCQVGGQADRYGNLGKGAETYDGADLRLAIVGSSYSMGGDEKGRLVNEVLMERLSQRLGRRVSILNFSRDATGVLTYVDTARHVVEKFKPHAIIALINVTALIYQRHWRVVLPEEQGFRRMYFSLDPVERPTEPGRAVPQAIVINDGVTDEWCTRLDPKRPGGNSGNAGHDPLIEALLARYQKLQREKVAPTVLIDFWRTDVSFAMNLLRYGEPFHGMTMFGDQPIYSPLALDRYSDDPGFNASVKAIGQSAIPLLPVHIPTLPEMRSFPDGGYEFTAHGVPPRRGKSLVADLERALKEPFVHLYRYYPPTYKSDPLQLVYSEADSHPNKLGVDVMAEALERMLLEHPATSKLFLQTN